MSLAIHAVDLFLYDLHIALGPLGDSSLLRPESAFLVDPEGYEEAFRTGADFETGHFHIRPLRRALGSGRYLFWHHYSKIGLPGMTTANHRHWHLLIPFLCSPKTCKIRLVCDRFGLDARVTPTILLWPFGWSTNLEVKLTGDLTPDCLRGLVAAFRTDDLFRISSFGTKTLSGVFRHLTEILWEDLYTDPRIGERRPISRQWVISLPDVRLSGTTLSEGATARARPFPGLLSRITTTLVVFANALTAASASPAQDEGGPGATEARPEGAGNRLRPLRDHQRISDRQRIELYSVLLGEELTPEEMAVLADSPEGFLCTPLVGDADFAMTDFDRGTLLFLADAAAAGKSRDSLYSLGANVRSCSLVGQALSQFLKSGRKWARKDSKIQALCETAATILYELPEYYTNPFCRRYFTTHRDLVRERKRYEQLVEGSGE